MINTETTSLFELLLVLNNLIGSGARNGARTRDNRNHNPGL